MTPLVAVAPLMAAATWDRVMPELMVTAAGDVLPASAMVTEPLKVEPDRVPMVVLEPSVSVALVSASACASWLTMTLCVPVAVPLATAAERIELAAVELLEDRSAARLWNTFVPSRDSVVRFEAAVCKACSRLCMFW